MRPHDVHETWLPLDRPPFFGQVDIDRDQSLKVALVNIAGETIFKQVLYPKP